MAVKTAAKPWTSGFCAPSNDRASHGRCHGHNGRGKACSCTATFVDDDDVTLCPCYARALAPTISEAAVDPRAVVSDPTPAGAAVATALPPLVITQPCILPDIDEETYHRDPVPERLGRSLSQSGAKRLLNTTPAHYLWEREHGRPPKKAFDYGHAAHTLVLGKGAEIAEVKFNDWRTKAAQEEQAAAYAEGKTPLLSKDVRKVEQMATALADHPNAGPLFKGAGMAEASLFWVDPATGVYRRARLDFARLDGPGRPLVVDYKSTANAGPDAFAKSVADFGYFMQDPWYCDGVAAHDLADPGELGYVFIAQEKDPPYAVAVYFLEADAVRIGRQCNRRALDLYAECQSSGIWPAYSEDPVVLSLPPWFARKHDEEYVL